MVSVYLIGASAVGKTTLIDRLVRESRVGIISVIKEVARTYMKEKSIEQADLENESTFWALEVGIAQLQLQREEEFSSSGESYVSDRSVIDALVYAALLRPQDFPLLRGGCEDVAEKTLSQGQSEDLLKPLELASKNTRRMVQRYRRSLVVLVNPFDTSVRDDGVRKIMSYEEQQQYTETCRRVLRLLGVPFFDLRETELSERVSLLCRAVKGELPSPLDSLEHFENMSAKKVNKQEASRHYRAINLAFYTYPKTKRSASKDGIPCIYLAGSSTRQTLEYPERGAKNRFVEKYGTERIFLLEFDKMLDAKDVQEILIGGVRIQGELYSFLGCSSSGLKKRKCHLWRGNAADVERTRRENGEFSKLESVSKQIARFGLLLSNVVPTSISPANVINEPDVENDSGCNFTDGCGCISPDLGARLFKEAREVLSRGRPSFKRPPSVYQVRYQGYKGVLAVNSRLDNNTVVVRPSMNKFETNNFPSICVCDYSRPYSFGHLNRQFILLLSGLGVDDDVFMSLQAEHFGRVRRMLHDRDAALEVLEWSNRSSELVDDGLQEDPEEGDELKLEKGSLQPPFLNLRPLQKKLIMESPKLRILVPESRTLFGVSEPPRFDPESGRRLEGRLRAGECLVKLTMRGSEENYTLHNQNVLVSKNPCYLLGDVRVLRAVSSVEREDLRELERDLVDCIVFPIEGHRPHSEEIAGSDLDGDQYFVCWDQRLVPTSTRPPYDYPAYKSVETKTRQKKATHAGRETAALVEYFSVQNKVSRTTGLVDALFRGWADVRGVGSPECERLGQLFSRVVDSAKSGERVVVPEALKLPKEQRPEPSSDSDYVWQRMEFEANKFVIEQQNQQLRSGTLVGLVQNEGSPVVIQAPENDENALDEEDEVADNFLLDLVSRNHLAMSEFTKFRLVMQYVGDLDSFFASALSRHVNFSLFTAAERGDIVARYGFPPELLYNALRCHSRLVGSQLSFLEKFGLYGKLPWQFYWECNSVFGSLSFTAIVAHALRRYTDALLILKGPDAVVVALRFSRVAIRPGAEKPFVGDGKQKWCAEQPLQGFMSVQAFFISGHFGYLKRYELDDPKYTMDLSDNGMQIYRGKAGMTFVHLKVVKSELGQRSAKEPRGRRSGRSQPSIDENDGASMVRLSVDLLRFDRRILNGDRRHPLIRKTPIHEMELFVYKRRRSNFSDEATDGIVYLDVLLNEDGAPLEVCCEEDLILKDEDSLSDLLPGADDLLEKYSGKLFDSVAPADGVQSFILLLREAHQRFGICDSLPEFLRDALVTLTSQIFNEAVPLMDPAGRLTMVVDMIALLAELDIDVPLPLSWAQAGPEDPDATHQTLKHYVEIVRCWDFWLSLRDPDKRDDIAAWLKSHVDVDHLNARLSFVFRNSTEQLCVLLSEFKEGYIDSTSSSSVSRLGNLRLDPSQPFWETDDIQQDESPTEQTSKIKLPTVTLYRVQAMPMGMNFAVGEYVCISKQSSVDHVRKDEPLAAQNFPRPEEYESEFPPLQSSVRGSGTTLKSAGKKAVVKKRTGICLARVVRVCDAPFSMSVKLVSATFGDEATPELLMRCRKHNRAVYWQVNLVPANVITHMRNVDAIASFLDLDERGRTSVSPLLFGYLFSSGPHDNKTDPLPVFSSGKVRIPQDLQSLNRAQAVAVRSSLEHRVSLVHGPPGTGKTFTAIQIMLQILRQSDHRIMVCAETNLAVDNLALRFLRECDMAVEHGAIRVGRSVTKKEELLDAISLETLVRNHSATKKSTEQVFLSRHKKIINMLFQKCRVVFTTCAGAGDPVLDSQQFESVLMDESSMTTEPCALCPIAHGCRHLVLIGDHKQLGPHANGGNCVSLFERLTDPAAASIPAQMTLLNEQHRMAPELCSFPSRTFYESKLVTAAGIADERKVPDPFFGGGKAPPVRFLQVVGGHEQRVGSGSWFNQVEAQQVLKLLQQLMCKHKAASSSSDDSADFILPSEITVLTPYRAQQMKIKELLSAWSNSDRPEVCSVDGFQGRENEVIALSTVRSSNSLGFCGDERRVNVLLTRAKRGLIILVNRDTLRTSPLWSAWLQEVDTPANDGSSPSS